MKSRIESMPGDKWVVLGAAGLLALAAVVYLILLLLGSGGSDRDGKRTACMSNLKQLAVCLSIYASDNAERLPPNKWETLMKPIHKEGLDLSCPSIPKLRDQRYGYAMNRAMLGLPEGEIETHAGLVLLFETDLPGPDAVDNPAHRNVDRHKGKANLAYADGHVRSIEKDGEPGN